MHGRIGVNNDKLCQGAIGNNRLNGTIIIKLWKGQQFYGPLRGLAIKGYNYPKTQIKQIMQIKHPFVQFSRNKAETL